MSKEEKMLQDIYDSIRGNDLSNTPKPESIRNHEGVKYLRTIRSVTNPIHSVDVDVYAVLEAFNVSCPARQQAIKKLLCCGNRGKGDELADLKGAFAAINRAVELQDQRQQRI